MNRLIIFDTDMNFGLPGSPVDSGLALLYLLGRNDIDIKGITINSPAKSITKTRSAVSWLLRLNGRTDIPIIEGCSKPGEYYTAASEYLSETAAVLSGELTIITTASLCNIYGASLQDELFYSHLNGIICAGGLLYPLQIPAWKPGSETRFSIDPLSAANVLNKAKNLVLMNMHIGSQAPMDLEDLFFVKGYNIQLYYLVKEYLLSKACRALNGKPATYLWSLLPALYPGNSNLFHNVSCSIAADKASLKKGLIRISETGNKVIMPDYITDIDEFYRKIHIGWKSSLFCKWLKKDLIKDSE